MVSLALFYYSPVYGEPHLICEMSVLSTRQETLLSLTNRATHLCTCNGVADFLKTPLPICVTMPNLVVLR